MSILTLDINHLSGNITSASKHTTQTTKVNEVVATVNEHSDINLRSEGEEGHYLVMDAGVWNTAVPQDIAAAGSFSFSATLGVAQAPSCWLTELLITQYCEPAVRTIETPDAILMYEEDAGPGDHKLCIISYVDTPWAGPPLEHYIVNQGADAPGYIRMYRIPFGMYRLGWDEGGLANNTIIISISNPDGALQMRIMDITLRGYEPD